MIRVEIEEENGSGRYLVCVASHGLSFKTRLPLLDTCRELKRMGEAGGTLCGLFRKGSLKPDATCTVGGGADLTVSENSKPPRFNKFESFRPFTTDPETFRD